MEGWASRIKESLDAQGLSQADLARACKIKAGSVSGWFGQGKPTKMISGDNLVAAAAFLGLTPEYIITGRAGAPAAPVDASVPAASQSAGLDDETMSQAVELLYLMGHARPDDHRFKRLTWAMIQIAAKSIDEAEGEPETAMAKILEALA